jgi:long-subunit acyl-CoA synthetase (AMP-forming)
MSCFSGTCNSDSSARSGSIGPLVASTWGKVVDDHGRSLPPRTPGELCIKGPQVMLGYMDEPDKTAECLSSSGWLRTGDLAYYDEDGYFYISDRLKELIKVRGYPVRDWFVSRALRDLASMLSF